MTLPISPNHSWYYWSLLTGCLRIATHCHNTVAKRWILLSLCHKNKLKCCAGDSLNKYYIRIFVKKRTSVNFNFERKYCGVDQMFLKDVTNVPTRSQSILSKLGKIRQELTVENVLNNGARDTCFTKWNFEIWAPSMAENALGILEILCFLYLKAFQWWPSPRKPQPIPPPPPPPNKYRTFPKNARGRAISAILFFQFIRRNILGRL